MKLRIAALAIALTLLGCNSVQPQSQSAKPNEGDTKKNSAGDTVVFHDGKWGLKSAVAVAYQRFVPIAPESVMAQGIPWHGYFALDTKTGTLCVTLRVKDFPRGVSEWANNVPKCNDVLDNDHD
jgi:hypothetical protein